MRYFVLFLMTLTVVSISFLMASTPACVFDTNDSISSLVGPGIFEMRVNVTNVPAGSILVTLSCDNGEANVSERTQPYPGSSDVSYVMRTCTYPRVQSTRTHMLRANFSVGGIEYSCQHTLYVLPQYLPSCTIKSTNNWQLGPFNSTLHVDVKNVEPSSVTIKCNETDRGTTKLLNASSGASLNCTYPHVKETRNFNASAFGDFSGKSYNCSIPITVYSPPAPACGLIIKPSTIAYDALNTSNVFCVILPPSSYFGANIPQYAHIRCKDGETEQLVSLKLKNFTKTGIIGSANGCEQLSWLSWWWYPLPWTLFCPGSLCPMLGYTEPVNCSYPAVGENEGNSKTYTVRGNTTYPPTEYYIYTSCNTTNYVTIYKKTIPQPPSPDPPYCTIDVNNTFYYGSGYPYSCTYGPDMMQVNATLYRLPIDMSPEENNTLNLTIRCNDTFTVTLTKENFTFVRYNETVWDPSTGGYVNFSYLRAIARPVNCLHTPDPYTSGSTTMNATWRILPPRQYNKFPGYQEQCINTRYVEYRKVPSPRCVLYGNEYYNLPWTTWIGPFNFTPFGYIEYINRTYANHVFSINMSCNESLQERFEKNAPTNGRRDWGCMNLERYVLETMSITKPTKCTYPQLGEYYNLSEVFSNAKYFPIQLNATNRTSTHSFFINCSSRVVDYPRLIAPPTCNLKVSETEFAGTHTVNVTYCLYNAPLGNTTPYRVTIKCNATDTGVVFVLKNDSTGTYCGAQSYWGGQYDYSGNYKDGSYTLLLSPMWLSLPIPSETSGSGGQTGGESGGGTGGAGSNLTLYAVRYCTYPKISPAIQFPSWPYGIEIRPSGNITWNGNQIFCDRSIYNKPVRASISVFPTYGTDKYNATVTVTVPGYANYSIDTSILIKCNESESDAEAARYDVRNPHKIVGGLLYFYRNCTANPPQAGIAKYVASVYVNGSWIFFGSAIYRVEKRGVVLTYKWGGNAGLGNFDDKSQLTNKYWHVSSANYPASGQSEGYPVSSANYPAIGPFVDYLEVLPYNFSIGCSDGINGNLVCEKELEPSSSPLLINQRASCEGNYSGGYVYCNASTIPVGSQIIIDSSTQCKFSSNITSYFRLVPYTQSLGYTDPLSPWVHLDQRLWCVHQDVPGINGTFYMNLRVEPRLENTTPNNIVLLFDVSGSTTTGTSIIALGKIGAEEFIQHIDEWDYGNILAFGTTAACTSSLSGSGSGWWFYENMQQCSLHRLNNTNAIKSVIDSLGPGTPNVGGYTDITKGLVMALKNVLAPYGNLNEGENFTDDSKHIILFSDGVHTTDTPLPTDEDSWCPNAITCPYVSQSKNSNCVSSSCDLSGCQADCCPTRGSCKSVIQKAKEVGVAIHVIGFCETPTSCNETLLRTIATETGGMFFKVKDIEGISNAYKTIAKSIKNKIVDVTIIDVLPPFVIVDSPVEFEQGRKYYVETVTLKKYKSFNTTSYSSSLPETAEFYPGSFTSYVQQNCDGGRPCTVLKWSGFNISNGNYWQARFKVRVSETAGLLDFGYYGSPGPSNVTYKLHLGGRTLPSTQVAIFEVPQIEVRGPGTSQPIQQYCVVKPCIPYSTPPGACPIEITLVNPQEQGTYTVTVNCSATTSGTAGTHTHSCTLDTNRAEGMTCSVTCDFTTLLPFYTVNASITSSRGTSISCPQQQLFSCAQHV